MMVRVGLLTRLWIAAVTAALLTAAVAFAVIKAADGRRTAVARADGVSRTLVVSQLLERHMVDVETGLRGYLPTRDRLFLAPFSSARQAMPAELARLEASAHDDDAQSTLAHSIYTAVEAYMHDYALPLASRPDAVTGARLDRITRRGKRRFDTLRALFDRFDDGALAARAVAERSATAADHLFSGVALAGVGGLLSALLWFVVYTARVVIGPVRRAVRACAALARGERDTELPLTGPSEVRELAAGFNAMAARMAEHAEGLERKAARDPLTGLLNRRGFEAALEAHTVFGERYGPQGALLLMDLDNFKLVNDTLGHARGDELLLACARALTGRLRETDAIGRLGGDEFAVLLPQEGLAEGARVAAHLITAVADATRTVTGDHGITVTGSIGVAEFGAGEDGEDILARADAAMYEAKAAGRNRYAVAGAGALVAYGVRM